MADNVAETYEAPELTKLGTLSELTLGGTSGGGIDIVLGLGSLLDIFIHLL